MHAYVQLELRIAAGCKPIFFLNAARAHYSSTKVTSSSVTS
jgi:hypothetical protein